MAADFNELEWGKGGSFCSLCSAAEFIPPSPHHHPAKEGKWNGAECVELPPRSTSLCISFIFRFHSCDGGCAVVCCFCVLYTLVVLYRNAS